MNKKETIEILLYNVALEHSAIIQYLYNIFLIGDAEITKEIESIARQEMRHLKWFAQKVVELGGKVSLRRVEEAIKLGENWEEMLRNDVDAEEEAIKIYTSQLELVKDDGVKKLLDRVINDEMRHREEFSDLLGVLKSGDTEREVKNVKVEPEVVSLLNKLLKKEYRLILDYLYHFFHSRTWWEKDTSLDIAIESMVHMGELGEKLGELGIKPDLSLPEVKHRGGYTYDGIVEDIAEEEGARRNYDKVAEKTENEEIKSLLLWIGKHEEYHSQRLKELLRKLNRFTVGSLMDNM